MPFRWMPNGDLEEEMHMAIPLGYTHYGATISLGQLVTVASMNESVPACKLTKSLYGVKKTHRQWSTKL